eukprot:1138195-Pelagomonas_calceolata.AAC.2
MKDALHSSMYVQLPYTRIRVCLSLMGHSFLHTPFFSALPSWVTAATLTPCTDSRPYMDQRWAVPLLLMRSCFEAKYTEPITLHLNPQAGAGTLCLTGPSSSSTAPPTPWLLQPITSPQAWKGSRWGKPAHFATRMDPRTSCRSC